MLSESDIIHIKALSEKDPLIKKIFDFYCGTTMDGVKAIKASLNSELLKLNVDLSKPDTNYDFALDRISEIAKTLKRLPKEEVPEEEKEKPAKGKEKHKSVFDNEADKKREA